MKFSEVFPWLLGNQTRVNAMLIITQPVTATQLARHLNVRRSFCCNLLDGLVAQGVLQRLNIQSWHARLYWHTQLGRTCQAVLREQRGMKPSVYDFPAIDWEVYGWACYEHRASIIKVMNEPLSTSSLKRKALLRNPSLRMNLNNVRDVIRLMRDMGLVKRVYIRKRAYPLHELTDLGRLVQRLLLKADVLSLSK